MTSSRSASLSAPSEPIADTTNLEHDAADQQFIPSRNADQTLYDSLPALVPVREAAQILGIPLSSLYRYAKNEFIPCERLGGRVYIRKIGIRRWLDDRQETQA